MDQNAGINRCYAFKGKLEAGSYRAQGSHSYEDQQSAGVNRDNICTGQLERADKMRQGE